MKLLNDAMPVSKVKIADKPIDGVDSNAYGREGREILNINEATQFVSTTVAMVRATSQQ